VELFSVESVMLWNHYRSKVKLIKSDCKNIVTKVNKLLLCFLIFLT